MVEDKSEVEEEREEGKVAGGFFGSGYMLSSSELTARAVYSLKTSPGLERPAVPECAIPMRLFKRRQTNHLAKKMHGMLRYPVADRAIVDRA